MVEQWQLKQFDHGVVVIITQGVNICRLCYKASETEALSLVKNFYPGANCSTSQLGNKAFAQLSEYFNGHRRDFDLPLDRSALSPFALNVHEQLGKVDYGVLISYGELAARAGSPRAARAVGRVMAANPFPLVVPCHRVIHADGTIGSYSGGNGSVTKSWLIMLERNQPVL